MCKNRMTIVCCAYAKLWIDFVSRSHFSQSSHSVAHARTRSQSHSHTHTRAGTGTLSENIACGVELEQKFIDVERTSHCVALMRRQQRCEGDD